MVGDGTTTTFHLVRHGAHSGGDDVLLGRAVDVPLSRAGTLQVRALALQPWTWRLELVQASPRQRTMQTATLLAGPARLAVQPADALDEVDFGTWSGRTFAELQQSSDWRRWNENRAAAATPAGSTMRGVQLRAVQHLERLHQLHPGSRIALVTHAEVVRVLLLAARSRRLDEWALMPVPLASVTTVQFSSTGLRPADNVQGAAA